MDDINHSFERNGAAKYQIKVQGRIEEEWSDWFEGMEITAERDEDGKVVTTLTGMVIDQAALQGVLSRIGTLNLKLLSVTQIGSESE